MWKILVAFLAFALLALFVIMKGGNNVDMMGEASHGTPSSSSAPAASTPAAPAASAPATEPAPATAVPAASK